MIKITAYLDDGTIKDLPAVETEKALTLIEDGFHKAEPALEFRANREASGCRDRAIDAIVEVWSNDV